MRLMDCHLHTVYSGHGEGSVAQLIASARERGFKYLCLTEHLPMPQGVDPAFEFSMSPQECRAYREELFEARDKNPDMRIVYGGEADWLGDNEDFLEKTIAGYEYVLASCHFIDYWEFDHPDYLDAWNDKDVDQVWLRYFQVFCDAASSRLPFSTMSHPDLVKKFGHRPSFDTRELYEEAAHCVAANARMVEVNANGLYRPCAELYPSAELLRAFYTAGVDCTVGSDSHRPSDMGKGIQEALWAMYRAGYRRVSVPRYDGDRDYIPIEEVLR